MGIIINLPLRGVWVPLANINIIDTKTHTYLTDPPNASGNGIDIIHIGEKLGSGNNPIKAFALWVFNNENQTVTVQPIVNLVNNGLLPDIALIPSYTVNSGSANIQEFPFDSYATEYISVQLSFGTAPTGASSFPANIPAGVYAVLFFYYG
jgi:hypothetical protein